MVAGETLLSSARSSLMAAPLQRPGRGSERARLVSGSVPRAPSAGPGRHCQPRACRGDAFPGRLCEGKKKGLGGTRRRMAAATTAGAAPPSPPSPEEEEGSEAVLAELPEWWEGDSRGAACCASGPANRSPPFRPVGVRWPATPGMNSQ